MKPAEALPRALASYTAGALLLFALALVGHYAFARLPDGEALSLGLLARGRDVSVLCALVFGASLLGSWTLRRLSFTVPPGAYRLALTVGIGFVYQWTAILLLAVVQQIAVGSLLLVLLLPLLLWREYSQLSLSLRAVPTTGHRWTVLSWVAVALGGLYVLGALSPPVSIDELTYHLTIPREYLDYGGVPPGADNFFRNFPAATSMLYLILMGLGSDLTPKLLHAVFLLLTIVVARHHAAASLSPWVARWAMLLFASQWTVQHGVIRANVDFQFTFYSLLSFFLLTEAMTLPASKRAQWAPLCGLFLGAAVAGKVQAVAGCAGMLVVLVYARWRGRVSGRQMLVVAGLTVAVYLPFLLRNVVYSFDPFIFFMRQAVGLGPAGLEYDRYRLLAVLKPLFMLKVGWITTLLTPLLVYTAGSFPSTTFDGFIDPLYLVTLPLAFLVLRRQPFIRTSLLYLAGFYGGWLVTAPLTRYALPVLPLLACVTMAVFEHLSALARTDAVRRAFRWVAASVVLTLTGANAVSFAASSSAFIGYGLPAFVGMMDRDRFVAKADVIPTQPINEVLERLERAAGRTGRYHSRAVFMVFASQSYEMPTRYYNDPFYVNLGILESIARQGDDPIAWLRGQDYGYVLFEAGRVPWLLGRSHSSPLLNPYPDGLAVVHRYLAFFRQRILPNLKPVRAAGPLILYRIAEPDEVGQMHPATLRSPRSSTSEE